MNQTQKLTVVCSWCGRHKTEAGEWIAGNVGPFLTHGACPTCFEIEMEKIRQMPASPAKSEVAHELSRAMQRSRVPLNGNLLVEVFLPGGMHVQIYRNRTEFFGRAYHDLQRARAGATLIDRLFPWMIAPLVPNKRTLKEVAHV